MNYKPWYYKPFRYSKWFFDHSSDEYNRCTLVIGTPLTGHLIIPLKRRACLTVYDAEGLAYVNITGSTSDAPVKTVELGYGINADIDDTGRLVGVEVILPNG